MQKESAGRFTKRSPVKSDLGFRSLVRKHADHQGDVEVVGNMLRKSDEIRAVR